jgi:hypothetical protein
MRESCMSCIIPQRRAKVIVFAMSSMFSIACFGQGSTVTAAAPEVFAPGVISGPANDGAPTFTPDGNTLYFARSGASWGFILESNKKDGKWTEPVIAPFSGQWSDSQPNLSPDGQKLIFVSARSVAETAANNGAAPKVVIGPSAVWEVDRAGNGWSQPVRLSETINMSPGRVFKPSQAKNGTLYFMARVGEEKTWRLYRAAYRNGEYEQAESLPFSDGNHTDVDPEIAPDESFLIFSSAGRANPEDTHEHLYIVFRDGEDWGTVTPLRYEGDYEKNPTDDGEANLSPDGQRLYFTSGRVVPIHKDRTREQAAEDFRRLNQWDTSNSNVWSISLEPWLHEKAKSSAGRAAAAVESVFDAALSEDALLVSMLHLAHFGHGIGDGDQRRMRVAAGEDDVDHLRTSLQSFDDFGWIEHAVTDSVVDLVEDDHVPLAGENGGACFDPGVFDHANVFRVGFCAADLNEAAAHLPKNKVVAEGFSGVEFAVVPRAFQELQHEDTHAVADGAQRGAHGSGRLAFAGAGIDEDEAFARFGGWVGHVGHSISISWKPGAILRGCIGLRARSTIGFLLDDTGGR